MERNEAIKLLNNFVGTGVTLLKEGFAEACMDAFNSTEWIPVEDRLPNIKQKVLFTYLEDDAKKIGATVYDKYGFRTTAKVTAWMPLPEPYGL